MAKPTPGVGAAQRQVADRPGRDYAWQRTDFTLDILAERRALRPAVGIGLRQGDVHEQYVAGIEPRIDRHQSADALDHQAGAGQDDDRQRNLDCHQRISEDGEARGPSPVAGLERRAWIRARCCEHRRQAEDDSGHECEGKCERQRPRVNGNAARRPERRELDRRRQLARHRRRRCPREQGTGGPTGQREDEPFGKDLPGQAAAAGPKRSADRKLPLTYRRLREQQVRDVHTCDQRHQHDGALEHQQGRAHRPDTEFVKTGDRRALVVVLLVLRRQLAADRFNLSFR